MNKNNTTTANLFEKLKTESKSFTSEKIVDIVGILLKLRDQPLQLNVDNCQEKIQFLDELLSKIHADERVQRLDLHRVLALNKFFVIDNSIHASFEEDQAKNHEICDLLVTKISELSIKEIENAINFYFNENIAGKHKPDTIKGLLRNVFLIDNPTIRTRAISTIISLLKHEDLKKILIWFIRKEKYDRLFFSLLYVKSEDLYNKALEIIVTDPFFKRKEFFEIVPAIQPDFEKHEFNFEILQIMFERFPNTRNKILDYLKQKEKRRPLILSLIVKFYKKFSNPVLDTINLSLEEHIKINEQINEHTNILYEFLKKNVSLIENESIRKKVGEFVIKNFEFFKPIFISQIDNDDLGFLQIFRLVCTLQKLDSDILVFLKHHFLKNQKYFFILACQLKKEEICAKLEEFLKTESSLVNFVAFIPPIDIYINVHLFKDQNNQLVASQLIQNRKDLFNELVSIDTLFYFVNKHLPILYFRTVMITLTSFPKSKNRIIELLRALSLKEITNSNIVLKGYIKTLKTLQEDGVEIVATLENIDIDEIVSRDNELLRNCLFYCEKYGFIPGRSGGYLKKIILKEKKRLNL